MSRHITVLAAAALAASLLVGTAPPAFAQDEPREVETTTPVTTEAAYRAALTTLSADTSGAHTITLGADIVIAGASDPAYTGDQPLTIDGQGQFTLDGDENSRVLFRLVVGAPRLTLRGVTITGGRASGSGFVSGGGIDWTGPVTIEDSTITDNAVTSTDLAFGGAVKAVDEVVITDSILTANRVHSDTSNATGGAVSVDQVGSSISVDNSIIAANEATSDGGSPNTARGGALDAVSTITFTDSIASGNSVGGTRNGRGGALHGGDLVAVDSSTLEANSAEGSGSVSGSAANGGLLATVTNSTVTDNTALGPDGAGAITGTNVTLVHSTVADNSGSTATGAFASDTLTSTASVISDQFPGKDDCLVLEATVSNGYNYDTDGTCGFGAGSGDVSAGADPRLGQDRHNSDLVAAAEAGGGGIPRTTMFPLNGSPLIDAIPSGACSTEPQVDADQRGIDRPFGSGCDIGAIEAVFPAHDRTDVTAFYQPTVRWITSTINTPQILNGFDDGTFGQTLDITRGQVVRMYYRAAGQPDVTGLNPHGFGDVTAFFEDAVRWAKANGIFDGINGQFRQADPINRGNVVRSLYGFAGMPSIAGLPAHGFGDVTPFYNTAVTWAKANGIADGFAADNTFRQTNNITRGNAGRIFYNTAQTPDAWANTMTAPDNMLFRPNRPT